MNIHTPYNKFHDIIDQYNDTVTKEDDKLPKIPLHGMRHTCATALISHGIDPVTVSHRLGHSKTGVTLNTYAHSLEEKDKEAANILEDIFKKNA